MKSEDPPGPACAVCDGGVGRRPVALPPRSRLRFRSRGNGCDFEPM